uniref:Uncharacterized protein n=1 Tax=Oncorhynchus tshawytscha TaxID=74940 RepID=A0AAZ3PYW8_ONCTS
MQGAIVRVFVGVAAAILNHPLLFHQEMTTLPEQDDEEQQDPGSKDGYDWHFWSAISLVIFSIEVCRQDLDGFVEGGSISSKTLMIDMGVLISFCERSIHTSAHENWRLQEFNEDGCLCGSANLGENMLCLLHGKNEKPIADHILYDLCSKNTPSMARDQVMTWFLISLTKAWGQTFHKYEFEYTSDQIKCYWSHTHVINLLKWPMISSLYVGSSLSEVVKAV